jgi:hypothetical protein
MPENYWKERGPSTRRRKVEYDMVSLAHPLYLSISACTPMFFFYNLCRGFVKKAGTLSRALSCISRPKFGVDSFF